jgi:predicted Rossmann fold flavoprotein
MTISSTVGKILFTHVGISGPTVLNLSRHVGELLTHGEVRISLNLFPGKDIGAVDERLREILSTESNKKIKNSLGTLFPAALVPVILRLSKCDPDTPGHSVTKEDRRALVQTVMALPMSVKGLLGAEKAIVTSGGLALSELDTRTMMSHHFPGLFATGDLLDIDRPSGGYSLQLCWTTGYVAGTSAAEFVASRV